MHSGADQYTNECCVVLSTAMSALPQSDPSCSWGSHPMFALSLLATATCAVTWLFSTRTGFCQHGQGDAVGPPLLSQPSVP